MRTNMTTLFKPALHLLFGVALTLCFGGAAISHFQQGHPWLSLCFVICGILYVSQAMMRYRAALRCRGLR